MPSVFKRLRATSQAWWRLLSATNPNSFAKALQAVSFIFVSTAVIGYVLTQVFPLKQL